MGLNSEQPINCGSTILNKPLISLIESASSAHPLYIREAPYNKPLRI